MTASTSYSYCGEERRRGKDVCLGMQRVWSVTSICSICIVQFCTLHFYSCACCSFAFSGVVLVFGWCALHAFTLLLKIELPEVQRRGRRDPLNALCTFYLILRIMKLYFQAHAPRWGLGWVRVGIEESLCCAEDFLLHTWVCCTLPESAVLGATVKIMLTPICGNMAKYDPKYQNTKKMCFMANIHTMIDINLKCSVPP